MTAMMLAEADPEPDDEALVALARSGRRDAFARLVERHYDYIHRVAWRWAGNRTDADDIAQEACVRLARAIGQFRGQGAFTTWVYALTLNVARDHGRQQRRETARIAAWAAESAIAPGPEDDDPAERLWACVRTLPDRQREAVTLVYGVGLSHAGAADAMGLSEPSVSWHVHEARKRLKAMLAEAEEDER
ncbi:MAG: RNA polymerase sigma factor [Rhizobiaceae bacterium]|nr:RNA polymerase sigma factor [Rhizobiaceae bacterium]MCV0406637.1 RNA polymerase sigma factor [Rhizobiaceae bacterium]